MNDRGTDFQTVRRSMRFGVLGSHLCSHVYERSRISVLLCALVPSIEEHIIAENATRARRHNDEYASIHRPEREQPDIGWKLMFAFDSRCIMHQSLNLYCPSTKCWALLQLILQTHGNANLFRNV
jgi:hypothetical protein